jgi:hypothetical protein
MIAFSAAQSIDVVPQFGANAGGACRRYGLDGVGKLGSPFPLATINVIPLNT